MCMLAVKVKQQCSRVLAGLLWSREVLCWSSVSHDDTHVIVVTVYVVDYMWVGIGFI